MQDSLSLFSLLQLFRKKIVIFILVFFAVSLSIFAFELSRPKYYQGQATLFYRETNYSLSEIRSQAALMLVNDVLIRLSQEYNVPINVLEKKLRAEPIRNSNVITLSYINKNKDKALAVIDGWLGDAFRMHKITSSKDPRELFLAGIPTVRELGKDWVTIIVRSLFLGFVCAFLRVFLSEYGKKILYMSLTPIRSKE